MTTENHSNPVTLLRNNRSYEADESGTAEWVKPGPLDAELWMRLGG